MQLHLHCRVLGSRITFNLRNSGNMGLGANEDGHCSTCDGTHLRPWGASCLAYKGALQQCKDLNVEETEYKNYLDFNLVRYSKDLPKIPGLPGNTKGSEVKDEDVMELYRDQIKQLTTVNLQQKAQIDALVLKQATPVHAKPVLPVLPPPPPIPPTDQTQILKQILDRLSRLESSPGHHPSAPVSTAAGAVGAASNVSDSPAVAAMGHMADAMAQLSMSIDPSSGSKTGQYLRPEYHYCVLERGIPIKGADASKLSISEYLYGMCLVLEHLIDTEGDWQSYFSHYKRMMKFFIGKKYVNSAYVSYDKEVVDSYIKHPENGFSSSDSLAIPTHFCSANEHDTQNTRSSRGGSRRGRGSESKGRITSPANHPSAHPPEDWPEDVCYVYNSSFCVGACNKQHICVKCRIRGHKMGSCRVNLEKN